MLDAYIIEQIRQREEERRRIREQPALELPLEPPIDWWKQDEAPEDEPSRVIVIDL